MRPRALFLDRDGVINEDKGYVCRQEDIVFVDGVFDLVATAKRRGYLVLVVTNQAGIGRGYYSVNDFNLLMEWVAERFSEKSGALDGIYFCPDHPVHGIGVYKRNSLCRKPAPGMLLSAIQDWNIDAGNSVLIGDRMSDIQAGIAAGVGVSLLFKPGYGENYRPAIHQLAEAKPYLASSVVDIMQ